MPRSAWEVVLLLFLIAVGLILVFSVGNAESGRLSGVAFTIVRPFHIGLHYIHTSLAGVWNNYIALRGLKSENDRLKRQIAELTHDRSAMLNLEKENQRLRRLLQFKTEQEFPTVTAQIIGVDAVGWYRTLFLNRGSDDRIESAMPVVVPEGVVGRIVKTSGRMSQVMVITDPDLWIDCRIVRTRDRGMLNGSLVSGCVVRYLDLRSQVAPGDEVVTSGLDGVFPKGLLLGRVKAVKKGAQNLYLEALVVPAVDFARTEEVMVVLKTKGGFDMRLGLDARP